MSRVGPMQVLNEKQGSLGVKIHLCHRQSTSNSYKLLFVDSKISTDARVKIDLCHRQSSSGDQETLIEASYRHKLSV